MWQFFFRSIEHDRCHETTYDGPEVELTCFVQAI